MANRNSCMQPAAFLVVTATGIPQLNWTGSQMSTHKVIYRDLNSDRLITPQEAALRDASTWREEVFAPVDRLRDSPRTDLPSVELIDDE